MVCRALSACCLCTSRAHCAAAHWIRSRNSITDCYSDALPQALMVSTVPFPQAIQSAADLASKMCDWLPKGSPAAREVYAVDSRLAPLGAAANTSKESRVQTSISPNVSSKTTF